MGEIELVAPEGFVPLTRTGETLFLHHPATGKAARVSGFHFKVDGSQKGIQSAINYECAKFLLERERDAEWSARD